MLHLPPEYRDQTGVHAPRDFAEYRTTALRHPAQPLTLLPQRLTEITGPVLGEGRVTDSDADLTLARGGEAQGQRIIVHGRVLDSDGRAIPNLLARRGDAWDIAHAVLFLCSDEAAYITGVTLPVDGPLDAYHGKSKAFVRRAIGNGWYLEFDSS